MLDGPLETDDGLLVVVAVAQRHPAVEPELGFGVLCRDRPPEGAEVVDAISASNGRTLRRVAVHVLPDTSVAAGTRIGC